MAENEGQAQPRPEPRRSFSEEFKREAVQLATERGNVSAVARDLGINETMLNRAQPLEAPTPARRAATGLGEAPLSR
jgi:transposase-like protein